MSFGRCLAGAACLLLAIGLTSADEKVRIEGLFDAEYWNTDGDSYDIGVNEDAPAGLGRLRLSALGEFLPGLQGFARGQAVGGEAAYDGETEVYLEQAFLRYTLQRYPVMIDAGKIVNPIGNFSRRYLSTENPLIGGQLNFLVSYPVGITMNGRSGMFDYMVGVLDSPMVNDTWVPESSAAPRPVVAAGLTPFIGTRIGVFGTQGPYLGKDSEDFMAAGESWKDFDQTVYGFDFKFSRGYFELNGELSWSFYEVPAGLAEVDGPAWFIEPKFTFSPRLFAAMRYEWSDWPYVDFEDPVTPTWYAGSVKAAYFEVALGYRIANGLMAKTSYRQAHDFGEDYPDARAVAVQLSYAFDVGSWFKRPL